MQQELALLADVGVLTQKLFGDRVVGLGLDVTLRVLIHVWRLPPPARITLVWAERAAASPEGLNEIHCLECQLVRALRAWCWRKRRRRPLQSCTPLAVAVHGLVRLRAVGAIRLEGDRAPPALVHACELARLAACDHRIADLQRREGHGNLLLNISRTLIARRSARGRPCAAPAAFSLAVRVRQPKETLIEALRNARAPSLGASHRHLGSDGGEDDVVLDALLLRAARLERVEHRDQTVDDVRVGLRLTHTLLAER